MLLGVDVGGTFTDAVLAVDGRLITAKSPTTPRDQSEGVLTPSAPCSSGGGRGAAPSRASRTGRPSPRTRCWRARGARTALVATAGFEDVVELGRQARADLYRLCAAPPGAAGAARAARRRRRADGAGRCPARAGGARRPGRARARHGARGGRGLPAARLPPPRARAGDRRGAARGAARRPRLALPRGGRHLPRARARRHHRGRRRPVPAAERATCAGWSSAAQEAGLPRPDVMQSTGGLADVDEAGAHAATTVLSGPAGGAAGAAWIAGGRRARCASTWAGRRATCA